MKAHSKVEGFRIHSSHQQIFNLWIDEGTSIAESIDRWHVPSELWRNAEETQIGVVYEWNHYEEEAFWYSGGRKQKKEFESDMGGEHFTDTLQWGVVIDTLAFGRIDVGLHKFAAAAAMEVVSEVDI